MALVDEYPFALTGNFCKGKLDAQFSLELKNIWSDNADYYQLIFSLDLRDSMKSMENLPESCK